MSVTLEQCQILRERHSLSQQHFSTSLDCMRRWVWVPAPLLPSSSSFSASFALICPLFLSFSWFSFFLRFLFFSCFLTCMLTPVQISSVLGADAGLLRPLGVRCVWLRSGRAALRSPGLLAASVFGPQGSQTAPLPGGLPAGDLPPAGSVAHLQPSDSAG